MQIDGLFVVDKQGSDGAAQFIDNGHKASISVYPNPTTENLNISALGMTHITMLNTLGQVVYDAKVDDSTTTLDMSQYQAGIYMVRVTTANGESVKLVTKQ